MKELRKTFLLLVFVTMASCITAQTLMVPAIEVKAGQQTTLTVSISQPTEATALQFCLQLPAGMSVNESECAVGTSAKNHTLNVRQMANGNYLFVLYSLDLQPLADGALMSIPVVIGSDAVSGDALLYTVRSAKPDATSNTCNDVKFAVGVTDAAAIEHTTMGGKQTGKIFKLNGQPLALPEKGVNIIDGRKIIVVK